MKIAILRDNYPESSRKWEIACSKINIEYIVIDFLKDNWLSQIFEYSPDFCVCRPPGDIQQNKIVFDEKMYFLQNFTPFHVYPGFLETYIYENKSALTWFLKANNIPHPETFLSSDLAESLKFAYSTAYPVVGKTLIGAAGSGVKILKNKEEVDNYIKKAFSSGIKRRFGPNRKTGTPKKWFIKALRSPTYFINKLNQYKERNQDVQKKTVLLQQYISHEFEWRCVKIGKSYFAYKKLKIAGQASGSKVFEYGQPPEVLLDFTRDLCERFNFTFMAIDVFYTENGILVNELQTIFGHKNPYICKIDETPGRFVNQNNRWVFEPGDFNTNESYDLRLNTALELHERNKEGFNSGSC